MPCEVQGSIYTFFWLQGPPYDFYLKEYSQIIMKFMISMRRNGKKVKRHFQFQTWHAMWSSGLHIFLLLTSGSSRCLVIERIFSNHHDLHYKYDKEWKKRKIKMHLKFQTWHAMWSSGSSYLPSLTSRSSRWLVFERIFSNTHDLHDKYDKEWGKGRSKCI